ncbi:hypothetical protein MKX01_024774 [Papaver californicum]|nr:hypothetical protein MKX01_024774 [Papaver californicum]
MAEVDVAFVQPLEHRPKPNDTTETEGEIPGIDLLQLTENYQSWGSIDVHTEIVSKIGNACRDWGFFQVINHGVPCEFQQRVDVTVKKFFNLPPEERRKVKRDETNPLGYYDTEHTKNVRDWKEVYGFTVKDPMVLPAQVHDQNYELHELWNQWPNYPPEFRKVCEEYAKAMEKLSFRLLEIMALSLGLPEKRLNGYFNNDHTIPYLALGVGHHKDSGAVTVLAQDDVGGLEVKRKTDVEWIKVRPITGSYIINVGDIIQVWSNDEYESAEHRVVFNSERERFLIPFFFNPSHTVMGKPLDELIDDQNPARYKCKGIKSSTTRVPIMWKEYQIMMKREALK